MKKKLLALLFFTMLCKAQTPITYTKFDGWPLELYKWEGEHVIVLSDSPDMSPVVMAKWLETVDNIYEFYHSCTGRIPYCNEGVTCFDGKTTVAWVGPGGTCGAACGYLGMTGIEITNQFWYYFYNQLATNNKYDHVQFYEFGRNFWFYGDKLNYNGTEFGTVTGYAIFMRFMAMETLGYEGADFDGWLNFDTYKAGVVNLLDQYMADDSLNWYNTLAVMDGIPGSTYSENDLFATFCLNLKSTYGDCWFKNLWKYVARRPNAQSVQDAVDNFIIASSQAAQTDLSQQFITWKWPVSDAAIAYLANMDYTALDQPITACTPDEIVNTNNPYDIGPRNITVADLSYGSGGYSTDNFQYYIDHTVSEDTECPLELPSAHLIQGNEYTITVTTGGNGETVKGWIDFNNNGTFEGSEIIISSTTTAADYAHTATFSIPAANVVFNTSLRMRITSDYEAAPTPEPCSGLHYGQAEDFAVIINNTAGVADEKVSHFTVYPNPATTVIKFSENVNRVGIYSIDGKLVLEDNNCKQIDINTLANGIYFILTDNNAKQFFIKK